MNTDKLIISAQNFELTNSIKETVIDKMNKVLSHDKNIERIEIVLEEKTAQKEPAYEARGNLSLHNKHFHGEAKESDMYFSINKLSEILLRDIRREHRKFNHERKHHA